MSQDDTQKKVIKTSKKSTKASRGSYHKIQQSTRKDENIINAVKSVQVQLAYKEITDIISDISMQNCCGKGQNCFLKLTTSGDYTAAVQFFRNAHEQKYLKSENCF